MPLPVPPTPVMHSPTTPVPPQTSPVTVEHNVLDEREDLKGLCWTSRTRRGHVPSRPGAVATTEANTWHALAAYEVLLGETQPALVTELLDRKEWIKDPEAIAAVCKEFDGLTSKNTWDLDTEPDLLARIRASGDKVHIGDVMSICSRKYAEMGWVQVAQLKGRGVFRGNNARDQDGALAV